MKSTAQRRCLSAAFRRFLRQMSTPANKVLLRRSSPPRSGISHYMRCSGTSQRAAALEKSSNAMAGCHFGRFGYTLLDCLKQRCLFSYIAVFSSFESIGTMMADSSHNGPIFTVLHSTYPRESANVKIDRVPPTPPGDVRSLSYIVLKIKKV